jgi:uncharacterized protein (UPF0548 family)
VRERRALSQRHLTYDVVGATVASDAISTPTGYRAYAKSVNVGDGLARWDFASTEVLRWGVKTRSGFSVLTEGTSDGSP